jgi:hypothetical protein
MKKIIGIIFIFVGVILSFKFKGAILLAGLGIAAIIVDLFFARLRNWANTAPGQNIFQKIKFWLKN